jgi:hypothetical protein
MRSKQSLRSKKAQQFPRILTSGKEQLTQLINTLRESGAPEHELKGLYRELRHEIHRDADEKSQQSPG